MDDDQIHIILLFARRERGNCKICWYAKDLKDVDTNGKYYYFYNIC